VKRRYLIFILCLLCFLTGGIGFFLLVSHLNSRIDNSLERGWFSPPVEYYTAPEQITPGTSLSPPDLKEKLRHRYYTQISSKEPTTFYPNQRLQNTSEAEDHDSDQEIENPDSDQNIENPDSDQEAEDPDTDQKTEHHNSDQETENQNLLIDHVSWTNPNTDDTFTVSFVNNKVHSLQKNRLPVDLIPLKPFLFAQYENGEPVLKQFNPLKKKFPFPFYCLQSVLAAEDHRFITHKGISLKSIIRAVWKNLLAGRLVEGGSTITQQLVKNIFFSHKKSFWRKFQEQIMALLLEKKLTKDEILNAYLNIVYMGQSGVFRIHGLGSAAEHYTGKPLSRLNLSECALLAGLIKSPGRYKPSADNTKILKRRNHILDTLYEKQIINKEELTAAKAGPIKLNIKKHTLPAYFTDTVYKKIIQLDLPLKKGLKVFTTLYPDFQEKALPSVQQGLNRLENNRLKKKIKNQLLQAALISIDVPTGAVRAVAGGRSFKVSQFNRAIQAKRQIGSLMKPVVVMSALLENPRLNPLSLVEDTKFTHKYGNKSWSPKNYKNLYKGQVPLYKALTDSLNAGIAGLGIQTGLEPLVQTIQKLGGGSVREAHPSLILGALEITPWQVAQMFLTIANMGEYRKQHIIRKVTDLKGKTLYKHKEEKKSILDPKKTAVVIGMLKEVTKTGTARWLKNFPAPVAGKTGTTNEEKDAWFVGFTPEIVTLVWVGFDNNQSHYLTGAAGALPIWEIFMRKILPFLSKEDFIWPQGVVYREAHQKKESPDTNQKTKSPDTDQTVQLIFEE